MDSHYGFTGSASNPSHYLKGPNTNTTLNLQPQHLITFASFAMNRQRSYKVTEIVRKDTHRWLTAGRLSRAANIDIVPQDIGGDPWDPTGASVTLQSLSGWLTWVCRPSRRRDGRGASSSSESSTSSGTSTSSKASTSPEASSSSTSSGQDPYHEGGNRSNR